MSPILYLHTNNYVHLDLKLENILITENKYNNYEAGYDNIEYMINNDLMLIDFDFSRKLDPDYYKLHDTKYKCGTNLYKTPEISNYKIGFTSDIYCLGLIFFILKFNRLPNKSDFEYQPEIKLYPNLNDIIFSMLEKDHIHRPTIFEVEHALDKYIEYRI